MIFPPPTWGIFGNIWKHFRWPKLGSTTDFTGWRPGKHPTRHRTVLAEKDHSAAAEKP